MKKGIKRIGVAVLGIIILLAVWAFWNVRDRHSGYEVDLNLKGADSPGTTKLLRR